MRGTCSHPALNCAPCSCDAGGLEQFVYRERMHLPSAQSAPIIHAYGVFQLISPPGAGLERGHASKNATTQAARWA